MSPIIPIDPVERAIEDLFVDDALLMNDEDLRALTDWRQACEEEGQDGSRFCADDEVDLYAPTHWVYAICNPDGTPFYVGQTNCLERRWQQHRASISLLPELWERLKDPSNRPVDTRLMYQRINRIATYLRDGTGPIFRELGQAWSRQEALALETTWVHRMTARGYKLFNPGEHRAISKQYRSHRRYEQRYHSGEETR